MDWSRSPQRSRSVRQPCCAGPERCAAGADRPRQVARTQHARYVPVPGDLPEHHAAGYANIMCSSVFITGLDPAFVAENIGYFAAPYESRAQLGTPKVDRANHAVSVTMPNGTVRMAKQVGSQGCVALPIGKAEPEFKPLAVKSALPDPATQPWPMGDKSLNRPGPAGVNKAKIDAAVEATVAPRLRVRSRKGSTRAIFAMRRRRWPHSRRCPSRSW